MRLPSFVLAAALIPQAYAWGAVGHEVVATIAQMHLHPSVMPKLCDILDDAPDCHLASVATWADQVRNQAKYRWTGPLHYIGAVDDYPSATCAFPGSNGWEGRTHINVLNAIRNTTSVLQEFEEPRKADFQTEFEPSYVQDALKFLIHFVGDMHMPLHLTGRNRGGNGDKVSFDGRVTNVHSVWDSKLISERIRTLPRNYTYPLPLPDVESYLQDTVYDPYIRRLVWEGLNWRFQDEVDTWTACPSSSGSSHGNHYHLHEQLPMSTWQHVLSLLPLVGSVNRGKGKGPSESGGGLGVDDDTLCPYAWAKPIHQLNCQVVFPKELDEARYTNRLSHAYVQPAHDDDDMLDDTQVVLGSRRRRRKSRYFELNTPEYAGMIHEEWIIEKLLAQAGIRLAGILNWIFADPEGDGAGGRYVTL